MRLLGLLLCLVTTPQGVLSQVRLQESGPGLLKPSQTLSLTCAVSGFSLTNYGVHWARQAVEKGPEWVGVVWSDGSTNYNPSLISRLSITRDTSKSHVYMTLNSLRTEDTAVYYCAREGYYSGGTNYKPFDYWGKGTMVTVSSVSSATPTLFPLSLKSTDQSGHVVIGCLVQGFFPSAPINVTWSQSGADTTLRNYLPMQSAGGLYTMTSQLTLPAKQCPKSATCHVQHNSSPRQDKTVPCKIEVPSNKCCKPHLTLHRPALEDLLLGSNANLTCTLSGLEKPEDATFTWAPTGGKDAIQGTPERNAFGCYSVSSVLPGCAEPWKRGEKFTCTVTHPEVKNSLSDSITKHSGSYLPPQVHLLPPPAEELALNELVTLTCVVRGFSPEDVLLRWLHGGEQLSPEKYLTWGPLPENSKNSTFAMTSVLRVGAENWKNGDTYSCMVGHEALPLSFTQKTIDRLAGKPTHVNVSVVLSEVDGTCY